jgi:hypothetical protein
MNAILQWSVPLGNLVRRGCTCCECTGDLCPAVARLVRRQLTTVPQHLWRKHTPVGRFAEAFMVLNRHHLCEGRCDWPDLVSHESVGGPDGGGCRVGVQGLPLRALKCTKHDEGQSVGNIGIPVVMAELLPINSVERHRRRTRQRMKTAPRGLHWMSGLGSRSRRATR